MSLNVQLGTTDLQQGSFQSRRQNSKFKMPKGIKGYQVHFSESQISPLIQGVPGGCKGEEPGPNWCGPSAGDSAFLRPPLLATRANPCSSGKRRAKEPASLVGPPSRKISKANTENVGGGVGQGPPFIVPTPMFQERQGTSQQSNCRIEVLRL